MKRSQQQPECWATLRTVLMLLWTCFRDAVRIMLGVASFAVFGWLALGLIVLTLTSNMDHGYAALDCGCVVVAAVIACRAAKRAYFPRAVPKSAGVAATVSAAAESADSPPATPDDPRANLYRPLINPNINDKTMWL